MHGKGKILESYIVEWHASTHIQDKVPLSFEFKWYEYFGNYLDIRFRPDKNSSFGFKLPISQIKPTVEETWDGITAMAEAIYPEFQQTGGDDEDQFISIG